MDSNCAIFKKDGQAVPQKFHTIRDVFLNQTHWVHQRAPRMLAATNYFAQWIFGFRPFDRSIGEGQSTYAHVWLLISLF